MPLYIVWASGPITARSNRSSPFKSAIVTDSGDFGAVDPRYLEGPIPGANQSPQLADLSDWLAVHQMRDHKVQPLIAVQIVLGKCQGGSFDFYVRGRAEIPWPFPRRIEIPPFATRAREYH